jgi:hypothetical protein
MGLVVNVAKTEQLHGGNTMNKMTLGILALILVLASTSARATTVLTFDELGIIPTSENLGDEPILNYYNGGFAGNGTAACGFTVCGPGPNDGVYFQSNALVLSSQTVGGGGNFVNEPSAPNILFFLTGVGDVMDVPGGITTGFSFDYSGSSAEGNGTVSIYSGLDGTGTLLASFVVNTSLTPLCTNVPNYCVWQPDGVAFSGTAESVVFGGSANFIGWDNITLGSSTPGGTPEPATLALVGLGLLSLVGVARRRKA